MEAKLPDVPDIERRMATIGHAIAGCTPDEQIGILASALAAALTQVPRGRHAEYRARVLSMLKFAQDYAAQ